MRWVHVHWAVTAFCLCVAAPVLADGHTSDDAFLLPYPDRITPLNAPVNVALRYGVATERRFVTDIVWGPEQAPGLYRLRAQGAVRTSTESDGPMIEITREATEFTFGPSTALRPDAGKIIAKLTPEGRYRQIELRLSGMESQAHRDQFAQIGTALVDTGRIPAFQRIAARTGPNDTGGVAQEMRERAARNELLEAVQPMLGFVLESPLQGASTGTKITVLRRDFGDLFRDSGPIPLRIDGQVVGLSEADDRRFLVVKLENADLAPPMRALVDGYALIDIETGLPETVVATIELVILQGADVTVFRFVERRALLPEAPAP